MWGTFIPTSVLFRPYTLELLSLFTFSVAFSTIVELGGAPVTYLTKRSNPNESDDILTLLLGAPAGTRTLTSLFLGATQR